MNEAKEEVRYGLFENKAYQYHRAGPFYGWLPVMPPVIQIIPAVGYDGARIDIGIWREVLAFFKWANDTSKSEVQVRLYFNENESIWKAWAFPQEEGTGMCTHEIPEECDTECQKVGLFSKNGWYESGTIHSHCTSSAWQSSTDKNNEETKNGVHITVGKLDEKKYDIDGRVSFRHTFYKIDWTMWFEMPSGLEGLPGHFQEDVLKYFLSRPVAANESFPDEWKANVIKKKWTTGPAQYSDPGRPGQNYGYFGSDGKYYRYDQSSNHADQGKIRMLNSPKLSKKETKQLERLVKKAGIPLDGSGDDDKNKMNAHRAALRIAHYCNTEQLDPAELFRWEAAHENMLEEFEKVYVGELRDICRAEGVEVNDAEAVIAEIQELEERVPTDGL